MRFFYCIGLKIYHAGIYLASFFNDKAKKWISGRKNLFGTIAQKVKKEDRIIWFHASSLGEFEQGRPVMEALREKYAGYKILLTFYSPSGYEIRKNYGGADFIFYLPPDSKRNAREFIRMVNPQMVFFIKYEFWYYYLSRLHSEKIPVYLISAIFRKDQVFFKWYGGWYRKILTFFTHIFVQDEKSLHLLESAKINRVSVSGDTRFDRVAEIARQTKTIGKAEKFRDEKPVVICGSTWEKDEELLTEYINHSSAAVKYIIAPHEIDETHIRRITSGLKKRYIRFSETDENHFSDSEVLIIDNIGMLSSLYKYGDIAYIGGGFGVGIHNILEPAVFGLPVIFGPHFGKFREAVDLVERKGAFSVRDYPELKNTLDSLMEENARKSAGEIAGKYIQMNCGATKTIMDHVFGK